MDQIINHVIPTAEQGFLTISVPPEYWANPNRIVELLEMTGNDRQCGAMHIEFGDKPDAILRKKKGGVYWVCMGPGARAPSDQWNY